LGLKNIDKTKYDTENLLPKILKKLNDLDDNINRFRILYEKEMMYLIEAYNNIKKEDK